MSKRAHAASVGNDVSERALAASPKRSRVGDGAAHGSAASSELVNSGVAAVDAQTVAQFTHEHASEEQRDRTLIAVFAGHLEQHEYIQSPEELSAHIQSNAATTAHVLSAADRSEQSAPDVTVDSSQMTMPTDAADTSARAESTDSTPPLTVVAPMFTPVHRSWEAFEQSLKEYAQATYQLYVIRTTTSVKRRNQRITENAASALAPSASASVPSDDHGSASASGDSGNSNVASLIDSAAFAAPAFDAHEQLQLHLLQQQLIPESYRWYSKTLMCTHGWKDRNRGSGKRSLSVARSTSCPAKMCVTLQHRGKGDDGWQVVLTRHVRTHNHQLSKELYLYYVENRRIYDPDLLLATGGRGAQSTAPSPAFGSEQRGKSGLSHLLTRSGAQRAGLARDRHPLSEAALASASGENLRREDARSVGIFIAPKAVEKTHASWDHFHKYIAGYAVQSNQSFRARSTVSVAAKNLKTKSLARKTGRADDETTALLVPMHERWYSKMLICSHGWKRKSRSKAPRAADDEPSGDNTCPAMLMARLQRDVHDTWHVVINRQVVEHNHPLGSALDTSTFVSSGGSNSGSTALLPSATQLDRERNTTVGAGSPERHDAAAHHTVLQYFGETLSDAPHDLDPTNNGAAGGSTHPNSSNSNSNVRQSMQAPDEVVVRAPKFQAVHASWDAFHAALDAYSTATFQLYRTRTTSSVQGRNQKIPDVKRNAVGGDSTVDGSSDSRAGDTRAIPEAFQWYSKTLTCTHGWKERRRGTGKRTVQVFRSTACPVKLCATVQFVENADGDSSSGGDWRVVVTKHIVDHNHNLSKELQQHYSENRRIYDPDLLAIDATNEAAVFKPVETMVHEPQRRHSFHISPDDHALLQPSEPPFPNPDEHNSSASAVSRSAPTSDRGSSEVTHASVQQQQHQQQQQHHLASVLHTFSLASDAAMHLGLTTAMHATTAADPGSSAGNDSGALLPTTGAPTATSHSVHSAPLLAYSNSSFPPLSASSHGMFHAVSSPAQPFVFQTHQYFALEQAVNLGFGTAVSGSASQHLPSTSLAAAHSSNSGGSVATSAYGASSSTLQTPCRVHGAAGMQLARVRSDGASTGELCTCFRSASGAKPLSAQHGNQPSILDQAPHNHQELQQQAQSRPSEHAFGHHDSDSPEHDIGDDHDGDEALSTAAWLPSTAPEIVTLTSSSGATVWRAPRIKRLHASWDALQAHLEAYSTATFQLFRVRTTSSVSARNARIAQQATDRRDTPAPIGADALSLATSSSTAAAAAPASSSSIGAAAALTAATAALQLVPESFQWYSKTFVCTHGWKERRRGKGQRVSHSLRSTACPAKLCVTLQRVLHDAHQWHVVVTRQGTDHNHELSLQAYQQYSEVRRIKDTSLLERAEALWQKGLSRRKIYEFLKDHAPNAILMKDVHNLVQRWQQQHGKAGGATASGDDALVDDDDNNDEEGSAVPDARATRAPPAVADSVQAGADIHVQHQQQEEI